MKRIRILVLLAFAYLTAGIAVVAAETITADKLLCPDADFWGANMLTDVCWSCIFPVRLMGATIYGDDKDVPDGAAESVLCTCYDNAGIPDFGITAALWSPAAIVEVVRKPYCSPLLGGMSLQDDVRLWGGHKTTENDGEDKTFYNYHYWAFPLFRILELFLQTQCNAGGYQSMDIMFLSELDPLWNVDELAFFIAPESAVFANPLAIAACTVDCAATAVRKPMETLFWCAGCWGNLYPFTGNIASEASPPRDTSLLSARILAGLHRRGLNWKTYGEDALCGGDLYPMLPKQQYRLSTLFPLAEADSEDDGKCCHYIGETPFKWGEHRTIPGTGEDYLYMIWRFTDCCLV